MKRQNQKEAMLGALQGGPKTSWQLQQLGICSHTSRISELRKDGHRIEKSEQWRGRTRIVTYRLVGQATLPGITVERTGAYEPTFRLCAECDRPFIPSTQARPLLPGEKPFCSDAHRAAFHRRKKESTDSQQISTAFQTRDNEARGL